MNGTDTNPYSDLAWNVQIVAYEFGFTFFADKRTYDGQVLGDWLCLYLLETK